jgi:hypothetical protein
VVPDLDIVRRTTFPADQLDAITSLKLTALPVAVAFLAHSPDGLSRIDRSDPAGRGWRVFDPEQGSQLQSMLGMMLEVKYIKSEEVPGFPHEQRRWRPHCQRRRSTRTSTSWVIE